MKGIYFLLIQIDNNFNLRIGKIGIITFFKGTYVYVGSAKGIVGGGELINRVLRHIRNNKRLFWHIDYLLNKKHSKIKGICIIKSLEVSECDLIKKIITSFDCEPILHFGSTDCNKKCPAHLMRIK